MPQSRPTLVDRLLLFTLTAALLLRLSIPISTRELFSTDIWPIVRDARLMASDPSVRIWDDTRLDGYNNHWPAVILSAVSYAVLTGSDIDMVLVSSYTVVIVTALLLTYRLLLEKLNVPSARALLFLAATPPLLVFTVSPLKEVYAYPLLYTLLGIAAGLEKATLITPLVAFSLAASHPLASTYAAGVLVSWAIVMLADRLSGSRVEADTRRAATLLALGLLTALILAVYSIAYGLRGGGIPAAAIKASDLTTYAVYALAVYSLFLLWYRGSLGVTSRLLIAASVAAALIKLPVIPVPNSTYIYAYAAPIAATLLAMTVTRLEVCPADARSFIIAGLLFTALNTCYLAFAKPALSSIIHRVLNYLNPILAAYIACLERCARHRVVASVLAAAALATGLLVAASLPLGLDDVSYYWVYTPRETTLYSLAAALSENNRIVGDAKLYYYLGWSVGVKRLLELAAGVSNVTRGELLVIRVDNLYTGIVSLDNMVYSPGRLPVILRSLSKVLDAGGVEAYAK